MCYFVKLYCVGGASPPLIVSTFQINQMFASELETINYNYIFHC